MNKKLLAMLSVFILVFGVAFSGCGKKVVYEKPKTTESGKIKIDGFEDIPEGSEIVIGDDGQSYLVDGEGNSVVYQAPSGYVIPNVPDTSFTTSTTASTTKKETPKPKPPTVVIEPSTTTTTTLSEMENIKKLLSENRGTGAKSIAAFANCNQNRLGIKFSDGSSDWLVELHKGSYGAKTIGCEMGFYINNDGTFRKVPDSEKVIGSVELYDRVSEKTILTIEPQNRNTGWIYGLKEGTLPNSNVSNLAMVCNITFPNARLADAFMESLEGNGFIYADVSRNTEKRYSCDETHKNVSFVW